jgi:hypothetical protein
MSFAEKDLRMLALAVVVLAIASGIISWTGFQGIYGEPEGSVQIPSTFTMVWPMIAQLGLLCLVLPTFVRAYQSGALPARATAWLTRHYRACLLVLVGVVALGLAIGVAALRAFPNSGDEYNYLFEAETFRAGRLWNPLPPVDHVFSFSHTVEKDGKWVSMYFPGWPLILAGITGLHLPSFVASPALALLLLLAFSRLTYLLVGPAGALLGATLLSCCPFYLLNGASYFSHVPTALFAVLFVLAGVRFLATGSAVQALWTGAALGAVGVMRPYTIFPLMIPYSIELLVRGHRRHYLRIPLILIGGLPFLAGLLLYDSAVTGNPWLTVQAWALPQLHLGLHPVDEDGTVLSLAATSRHALRLLFELSEWTSPLLCLLYLVAALWKCCRGRVAFYDLIFPLLVLSYLLFPALGGNRYGPRYYFDAYPFLVLTVVSAAAAWLSEQGSGRLQTGVVAALAAGVVVAVSAYPALTYQFHRIVNERMEPFDLVAEAHLSNAVVIIGSHTGSAFPIWMGPRDLIRNGINFSGTVLYADEVPGGTCALARVFSGRSFYRYELGDNRDHGQLRPISPCPYGAPD